MAAERNPYASPGAPLGNEAAEHSDTRVFALRGRLGRLRYLVYTCTGPLLVVLPMLVGAMLMSAGDLGSVVGFVVIVAGALGATVMYVVWTTRRLNDTDQSGWLSLILLVPLVGVLLVVVLLVYPGSAVTNRFGPPPPPNPLVVKVLGALLGIAIGIGVVASFFAA